MSGGVTFLSLILLIGWEVLNDTIIASVYESDMIIQIIKGYGSYARLKFLVNVEPLNREPVNRYLIIIRPSVISNLSSNFS